MQRKTAPLRMRAVWIRAKILNGGDMICNVLLTLAMATSCPAQQTQTVTRNHSNWQPTCCLCSTAIRGWCSASWRRSRGSRRSSRRGMRTSSRRYPLPLTAWRRRRGNMPRVCPARRCSPRFRRPRARRLWRSRRRKRRRRR